MKEFRSYSQQASFLLASLQRPFSESGTLAQQFPRRGSSMGVLIGVSLAADLIQRRKFLVVLALAG